MSPTCTSVKEQAERWKGELGLRLHFNPKWAAATTRTGLTPPLPPGGDWGRPGCAAVAGPADLESEDRDAGSTRNELCHPWASHCVSDPSILLSKMIPVSPTS